MSQQRLKDPYTSGTMLAFGIQAKLVKAIYIISWMSSWLPRPRQQPAIIFPKMHLCIFCQTEFRKCSLHLGMWHLDYDLSVACSYCARQSAQQGDGAGMPTLEAWSRAEQAQCRRPGCLPCCGQSTSDSASAQDGRLEPGGCADKISNKGTGHFWFWTLNAANIRPRPF